MGGYASLLFGHLLNVNGIISFGPQTFIFKDGYPDNDYIEKQWTLNYDISGGEIATSDGRLTIKQKSLV